MGQPPTTTSARSASTSASVRSRGQQVRRDSFTRSTRLTDGTTPKARSNSTSQDEKPILGGMTALDMVVIAAAYAVNLLKTLGLAELLDIAVKSLWYCITSLPFDFYKRWKLSHPQPSVDDYPESDTEPPRPPRVNAIDVSQRPHPVAPPQAQLSPFHHLVILITRFACMNFPHLLPRVLFAEDTMLPFVGWRTGGASWELMKEIRGEDIKVQGSSTLLPSFRAIWMGPDAYASSASRRQSLACRKATTIMYLHGGGFSLGSVSFYAEALLRVLNKVCQYESLDQSAPLARCIAVEYDLSPIARFPAPLLQCLRCYAHLVEVERIDPSSITFAGDSAGGNLAMAMMLAISGQGGPELNAERNWSKLPMPGQAVLISPWVDLRPSEAYAFAGLRATEAEQARYQNKSSSSSSASSRKGKQWRSSGESFKSTAASSEDTNASLTAAITSYEWDYIAAETLLHYAQVYAGVLKKPRRVMGPLGWVAHLGEILSRGLEQESRPTSGGKRSRVAKASKQSSNGRVTDPARRLARAVKDFLDQPLFEHLVSGSQQEELQRNLSSPSVGRTAVAQPAGFTSALAPIFSLEDRRTDSVRSTKDLYLPINAPPPASSADLDLNPVLSPILGDWSKIQLQRGCLVTWGERELMSADIESWVEVVHSGMGPEDLLPSSDPDRPRQDGEEERERYERLQRGKWLKTAVEHGSGGVHAWPFVAMYLAGTEAERDKGLELLARFIARPIGISVEESKDGGLEGEPSVHLPPDNDSPSPEHWPVNEEGDYDPHYSPGSLPSDFGEDGEDTVDPTDGSQSPFLSVRGGGRAFTEAEFKEVMGLGVQYGREPTLSTVSSSRRVINTAQVAMPSATQSAHSSHRISLTTPTTPPSQSSTRRRSTNSSDDVPPPASSSSSSHSSTSTSPSSSMKGSISRRMELEHSSGQVSRGRRPKASNPPLWWTQGDSTPAAEPVELIGRQQPDVDDEESVRAHDKRASPATAALSSSSPSSDSPLLLSPFPPPSVSVSGATTVAHASTSVESEPQSEVGSHSQYQQRQLQPQPKLSPSYFGLSFALRRGEAAEEGLSDIAEESNSVMSSGFASIVGGSSSGGFGSGVDHQYHQYIPASAAPVTGSSGTGNPMLGRRSSLSQRGGQEGVTSPASSLDRSSLAADEDGSAIYSPVEYEEEEDEDEDGQDGNEQASSNFGDEDEDDDSDDHNTPFGTRGESAWWTSGSRSGIGNSGR